VFFLDQPIGTGFSYSSSDETVGTTYAASDDVNAFLKIWKSRFPKYKDNAFHIAGESYAGHYIPVFAADALKKGNINLKSVMIGNGFFSQRE
jgi:cathepsin A (carboxypeptidase C)